MEKLRKTFLLGRAGHARCFRAVFSDKKGCGYRCDGKDGGLVGVWVPVAVRWAGVGKVFGFLHLF